MGVQTTYFVSLVLLFGTTNAARILSIFTTTGMSHFVFNHAILESLRASGHQITMITPVPLQSVENFTYINSSTAKTTIFKGRSPIENFADRSLSDRLSSIIAIRTQYCYDVMELSLIQETLKAKEKLFDVILLELLEDYECYLPLGEKLNVPVIGTTALRTWKMADHAIGVLNNPAVLAVELASLDFPISMSFLERIENLWNYLVVDYYYWKMRKEIEKFYRRYFEEDFLYRKRISLVFYNNHPSILARLTTPNAIEIGGIHLKPSNPLPEKFQSLIDEAPHGVILMTFGSVIKGSSLGSRQREAFLNAFASIPQRVIWKYEDMLENLPTNIVISNWLPQRDILEHKNVVAFISHCGVSGMYEAIMTGTPVVAIPLVNDQFVNAATLHHKKVAVYLNYKTLTKESVLAALNVIINDTSYYQQMQKLSRVFKDRPKTVQESVVYWTEYIIKYDGAMYMKEVGMDIPFYKYFMLDIIGSAVGILTLIFSGVYYIIRKIYIL